MKRAKQFVTTCAFGWRLGLLMKAMKAVKIENRRSGRSLAVLSS